MSAAVKSGEGRGAESGVERSARDRECVCVCGRDVSENLSWKELCIAMDDPSFYMLGFRCLLFSGDIVTFFCFLYRFLLVI